MELNRKNSYIGLQRIKSNASLSNKKQKSLINLNLSNNMIIDDDENIISQKNEEIKKLNQAYSDLEKKNFEINLELKNEKNKYDTVTKEKNDLIEEKNKILKEKNELGITNNKLNSQINILNERIVNLNSQIQNKINDINNLHSKISAIMKSADEKFFVFEQNMDEIRKDNRSWRKAYEKLLGKKKLEKNEDNEDKNIKKDNIINLDENKDIKKNENEKLFNKEITKLKIALDNLKTENSLLKYRLSIFNIKDSNNLANSSMNNYNNNLINSTIIPKKEEQEKSNITLEEKYLSLIDENKELKEIIKKLEDENKSIKYNIMNNLLNTDMSSAYNYLNKELESISKEKGELESKLRNTVEEKNNILTKYIHYEIENKSLQTENKALKNFNTNLLSQIEKLKSENNEKKIKEKENEKQMLDIKMKELIQKSIEEKDTLNNKINELERKLVEKEGRLSQFQTNFNHDYGLSKKIRILINYLNKTNQTLESKISEHDKNKETYQNKLSEYENVINNKNQDIENLKMNLEENMKKYEGQITRYEELNKEYKALVDLTKEKNPEENNNNINNNDANIKKSYNELLFCLNKYKEILPALNQRLEEVESENKNLKEEMNIYKDEINNKKLDLLNLKEKENTELKNSIELYQKEKEELINYKNLILAENEILKNDIISIGQILKSEEVKKSEENKDKMIEEKDEGDLVEELFKQLIKSKSIIDFLSKEK